MALIIPQGKIVDFIDGTLRNETPEEYVRQEIEKSLVREYKYPREEIAVEFRIKMGVKSKRADLVVFPEKSAHRQEHDGPSSNARRPACPLTIRMRGLSS